MDLQAAQQYLADSNAHKITWDDNQRSVAQNVLDNADPAKQAMKIAQQAQQMQIAANQPAIATLQGQQGNLSSAYGELLKSVLGQGTVAMNSAIKGENTLLGQRGITDNTSPLYQQQLTQAELPVTAQNQSSIAQVGMGSAQDLNSLAAQIASLQAGNVPGALSFANNLTGIQAGITNTNTQYGEALKEAQLKAATPFTVSSGEVYNPSTQGYIFPKTGGGGNSDMASLLASFLTQSRTASSRAPMTNIGQFVRPS